MKLLSSIDENKDVVTKEWVEAKGYTTNTGTITGVQLNGDNVATSGIANIKAIPNTFGSSSISGAAGTIVPLVKYGNVNYNGSLVGTNILNLSVNRFYHCYERGATVTCNYYSNPNRFFDGAYDGYDTSINPSTAFVEEPFVLEMKKTSSFEMTDVSRLLIIGHRLYGSCYCKKYKIEVAYNYSNEEYSWDTVIDYDGSAVDICGKFYGLYCSAQGSSSAPWHRIFGIRLTISESTSTVLQIADIQLICGRGTEQPYEALHVVSDAGGTFYGNVAAPTFIGALTGTALKATGDKNGDDITTTYYKASNPNGYTSNTGTITGINMNGASKGTSGVVDLGTVLTSHQSIKTVNNNTMTGTGNVSVGTITKVQANGTDVASSGTANIPAASTSAYGVTKLSNATDSTSEVLAATPKAVKAAYDLAAGKGTGTITGVSVNGTSVATSGVANITSVPASILSGAIKNGVTATTQSAGDNSTKVATTAYVDTAITNLPEPMIFKGSLGTGGTITTLPTASSSNEGYTYKVITAGTYASQSAKVGDTFISDGSSWVLIPSGDEPSGTVTSVTLKATGPIAIDSESAITSSGTRTLSHANSGVTAGTYKSVTVNATGHVTGGTNPTTLSGYGITDAKINNGTITLGSNSITPLTSFTETDPVFSASPAAGITAANITAWNSAEANVQADWNQATTTADDYIKNKPTIPTKTSQLTNDGATSSGAYSFIENHTPSSLHCLSSSSGDELQYTVGSSQVLKTVQDKLVSGTTIKTINGNSLLGSGDITVGGGSSDYSALTNKPQINGNELSGNKTAAQLGFATVATSGSYNDLSNKPTIPTVNNGTLTIQKNGTTVATFTANQSGNSTANITVPGIHIGTGTPASTLGSDGDIYVQLG